MDIESRIAQLNKEILETKLEDPNNFQKIRKLQMELDKLYADRYNTD
jgi:hypothetical protein